MKTGTIKIIGLTDYDDYCTYTVAVATEGLSASISFFGYGDEFRKFGEALVQFPFGSEQEVVYHFLEDTGQGPGFLLLKAYCVDPMGHTALQVIVDNCEKMPRKRRLEFSILAEPASLSELGKRLVGWDLRINESLEWEAQTS